MRLTHNFKLQNNNKSRFLCKNLCELKNSIANILLFILNSEIKLKWYSEEKLTIFILKYMRQSIGKWLIHNYSFVY